MRSTCDVRTKQRRAYDQTVVRIGATAMTPGFVSLLAIGTILLVQISQAYGITAPESSADGYFGPASFSPLNNNQNDGRGDVGSLVKHLNSIDLPPPPSLDEMVANRQQQQQQIADTFNQYLEEQAQPMARKRLESVAWSTRNDFAPLDDLESSLGGLSVDEQVGLGGHADDPMAQLVDHDDATNYYENEIYLLEDKDYPRSLYEDLGKRGVGQVSGVTTLPGGDVAIVHRSNRRWTNTTFNQTTNMVAQNLTEAAQNLLQNNTIVIIDRENGSPVAGLGANLFYLPHSIASDSEGNLWVSDVARHQVMRLPTGQMKLPDGIANDDDEQSVNRQAALPGNLSTIWPDIILGEQFVPGNDDAHFCKPSEIVVSPDGRLVFVADGYCNKRVMVFTGAGQFVSSFGSQLNMNIVHCLALMEDRNLICVGDRETSRILCFRAGLDGDLTQLGQLELVVNYPLGRVYAMVSISPDHLLVSSSQLSTNRYDLAILNPFTKGLKLVWTSSDLLEPHSLAKTKDGQLAYAADASPGAYKKVFRFNVIQRLN